MKSKFKKQKRAKNKLTKESMCILPIFLLSVLLPGVGVLIFLECAPESNRELWGNIAFYAYCGWLVLSSAATLFIGIPTAKKRQALRDFKTYDFDAVPIGDETIFECKTADSEYIFRSSVFESDGVFTFNGPGALLSYLFQFGKDELIESRPLSKINDPDPMVAAPISRYVAECKTEGERTVITVYESNSLTLKRGEIILNGESYTEGLHAKVMGFFTKINAEMRVLIYADETVVCHVKFSRKIVDSLQNYGICIDNKELLDFVLSNPRKAFIKLGKRFFKPLE